MLVNFQVHVKCEKSNKNSQFLAKTCITVPILYFPKLETQYIVMTLSLWGVPVVVGKEEIPDRVDGGAGSQQEPQPAHVLPGLESEPGDAKDGGADAAREGF